MKILRSPAKSAEMQDGLSGNALGKTVELAPSGRCSCHNADSIPAQHCRTQEQRADHPFQRYRVNLQIGVRLMRGSGELPCSHCNGDHATLGRVDPRYRAGRKHANVLSRYCGSCHDGGCQASLCVVPCRELPYSPEQFQSS